MRSAAAAIAWELRRRHRSGLIAIAGSLLVLAAIRIFILQAARVHFRDAESFALVVVVPLAAAFTYFLAVFSFGLSGDFAARQSIYPARMFTLPVTTAALVGWPMIYGTAAMAVLWLAARFVVVWPSDVEVPIVWPALMAASLLAWTQALTWMSYPLPGLRAAIMVVWLATIDAVIMTALQFKPRETVMLAILAPHVPLAYLTARFAVARARRGELPDWRLNLFGRRGPMAAFRSAARAQTWFEWKQHGRTLPWLVAIVLPFQLALLFPFSGTPELIYEILLFVLFTPPFMAAFVAVTVSKPNTTFTSTRPMTSVSLIGARMKATIASTLASWLLVLIAVPIALRLSGAAPLVVERGHRLVELFGMPRAIAMVLLALAALMASTWKQLVQSLYIGMSGRDWIAKASGLGALSFLAVILPLAVWISKSKYAMAVLWNSLTAIAAVLVCLKLSAAIWVAMRLRDRRLLSDRTLILSAVLWDVSVFVVYGVLVWLLPSILIRNDFLVLLAALQVPLVRVAAAPLALAWNRHR